MSEILNIRPSWFVGAAYNRTEDQTPRFLAEGIWENGYEDGKYSDLVRSMRPGDRIAIKPGGSVTNTELSPSAKMR